MWIYGLGLVLSLAAAVEKPEVYTGPVEVTVADDFERGGSTTIYRFLRNGETVSAYQRSADAPAVRCGDILRIEGVRDGDGLAVRRAEVAGRSAGEAGCETVGEQRVAVILVTFPGTSLPAAAESGLRQLLFDGGPVSANTWYRDQSYGNVSLSGDVYGPYALDQAYSCGQTAQMQAAAIRAADGEIDFRQYQRYILVFPPIRDCFFGGMGTLGCSEIQTGDGPVKASWMWTNYTADPAGMLYLLMHEFGHNLGMGHSRLLRFPGETLEADGFRGVPLEYGDSVSVMGSARSGGLAAAHRAALGWLAEETDIREVERSGDFVVAPLESSSGVRVLKVRRRIGGDEWLWLEYRPGAGGAVIRRETPESGAMTHLLDMTAATLDEGRFDLGESSEANPTLPAWTTWSDPHSELTIMLGEERAEGLDVFVRYDERCAAPDMTELAVSDWEQEVAVPVAAGPGCEWQAKSGRTWLSVARGEGQAVVKIGAIPDNASRAGVVTVGRNTVRVVQKAAQREMTLLSVSPPGAELPVGAPVPVLLHLRDENGVEDLQTLQLSVTPGPGSAAAPCYFRYSGERRVVEVSEDGETYREGEKAATGTSGSCSVEALIYRVNRTDVIFRFFLNFAGPEGETLTISVRAEEASGTTGPWVRAAEFQTTRQCRALPTVDYLAYLAGGYGGDVLTVRATSSPCAWTATTDAEWIRLGATAGDDGGALPYVIAANSESTTREGRIFVNGAAVRVVQYGNGEPQSQYVTLRPTETEVSGFAAVGLLTFYYGLGDLVPAEPEVPWLRVLRVERAADRREIRFLAEQNPEAAPRVGTILVGGKPFTVLQRAGPAK